MCVDSSAVFDKLFCVWIWLILQDDDWRCLVSECFSPRPGEHTGVLFVDLLAIKHPAECECGGGGRCGVVSVVGLICRFYTVFLR